MGKKIVSDSSCDILAMEGTDFTAVPLTIMADGVDYVDDGALDVHGMLEKLRAYNGRSYTACPSVERWLNSFDGAQEVYAVAMTSGLSGTWNAAMVAREEYLKENPGAKVQVFDTLSTGPEQRLLVERLAEWIKQGLSFDVICAKAKEYLSKTRLFFSLESLHNFAQNGRVSKLAAAATGILGIRIVGTASEAGTLQPLSKCRGEHRALVSLLEWIEKAGFRGGHMLLCHIENLPFAEKMREAVLKRYPMAQVSIYPARGLCSYYAECGGLLIGCECEPEL